MDAISAALLHKALDGLNQRSLYHIQNIANQSTEGYRPVGVSFEEALQAAASEGLDAIDGVEIETRHGAPDSLRVDLELGRLNQTGARYSALVEILGRQMALQRSVVSNGGR